MLKLRINPLVAVDLKGIRAYIAEDNEEYAVETIKEIYSKFENIQMFPGIGADLSRRVNSRTDYKSPGKGRLMKFYGAAAPQ